MKRLTKPQTIPIPIIERATGITTGRTSFMPPKMPLKEVLVIREVQSTVEADVPPVASKEPKAYSTPFCSKELFEKLYSQYDEKNNV